MHKGTPEFSFRRFDPRFTTMTVTATVPREFRVRLWIAMTLFRLGTWILGASYQYREDPAT